MMINNKKRVEDTRLRATIMTAALAERDALQAELDKIYAKAGRVQEQYNVIDDKINAYEQEQRALDE